MSERGYDALLVAGRSNHNAPMYYLANGANVTERSVLIKKRGADPVLYVNMMDRDEAQRSGLPVVVDTKFDGAKLLREANGDQLQATARKWGLMLADAGVTQGTVAAFGQADLGAGYELLTALSELHPQYNLTGEYAHGLLETARATKDAAEVKRIRAVGKKTMRVVASTEAFLTSHRARGGYLVHTDGSRLTIGDVKRHIRQQLTDEGL